MKKRILAITSLAVMLLASPANAVWTRPANAPLLDREGTDSGCVVSPSTGQPSQSPSGPYAGSPGWIDIRTDLQCTHGWRAWTQKLRLQMVNADGTRGVFLYSGGGASGWMSDDRTPSPDPWGTATYTMDSPCLHKADGLFHEPGTSELRWLLPRGENHLIIGGYAKVNEYKSDLHPYRATAEKEFTVTCTRERRAFR